MLRVRAACAQVEGEAGVIESIELVNFMNHAHTLVNFRPHINFITGINGGTQPAPTAATPALRSRADPAYLAGRPGACARAPQPASPRC